MPPESIQPVVRGVSLRAWIGAHTRSLFACVSAGALLLVVFSIVFLVPPPSFPHNELITVPEGASVIETGALLEKAGAIRSPFLFRVLVAGRGVQAGVYVFSESKGLIALTQSIVHGKSGMAPVRITFPEGVTVREMADLLRTHLASFNATAFVRDAASQEGYLFPDTYFFSPFADTDTVIQKLRDTFTARTETLDALFSASPHTRSDVIIMASLLEKEARTLEDKRMVAGILWKRLSIGMALQVDAVFGYIKGTETYHPSLVDLELDSPYNTYRNRGLPPGPIANPGLESIEAALTPIESDYLYYLTGSDGVMRYARTFDEHRANRAKYLE